MGGCEGVGVGVDVLRRVSTEGGGREAGGKLAM